MTQFLIDVGYRGNGGYPEDFVTGVEVHGAGSSQIDTLVIKDSEVGFTDITDIDALTFADPHSLVFLKASEVGPGHLSPTLAVHGPSGDPGTTKLEGGGEGGIIVSILDQPVVDLSLWTFTNWPIHAGDPRVIIYNRLDDNIGAHASDHRIIGSQVADRIEAGRGSDTVFGGGGDDLLAGYVGSGGPSQIETDEGGHIPAPPDGNNLLFGGDGNDILVGAGALDTLTGGPGKDVFWFRAKLVKDVNIDHLTDYVHGSDKMWLDATTWAKSMLDPGRLHGHRETLDRDFFFSGKHATKAHDADDHIIYNTKTGALYFDKDGKGGTKAIEFAILDGSPDNVSAKDFFVTIGADYF